MTASTRTTPRTSRPLELAGPGERPAVVNTQEGTRMSTADVTARHTASAHPYGRVGPNEGYAERLQVQIDERDAAFVHAPFCDHPEGGTHSCTSSAPALPGVTYSVRELPATAQVVAWSEEGTRESRVAMVIEHPYDAHEQHEAVYAEAWLSPATARALAAQLLDAARQADAAEFVVELNAVAESDAQLTELGVLFTRVDAGDFSTVTEVGDAMRRIVGAA